jgi:hypothetical protein
VRVQYNRGSKGFTDGQLLEGEKRGQGERGGGVVYNGAMFQKKMAVSLLFTRGVEYR